MMNHVNKRRRCSIALGDWESPFRQKLSDVSCTKGFSPNAVFCVL